MNARSNTLQVLALGGIEMSEQDVAEPDRPSAFHNIQSTFTPSRRARPTPFDVVENGDGGPATLKAGKLQRTGSKGGLRAMFTRNKLEKDVMPAVLEEPLPDRRPSEARTLTGRSLHSNDSTKKAGVPIPSKMPRMNLRSKPAKDPNPLSKAPPKPTKSNLKSITPRSPASWDPPPLFQAYSQAIKHAQLSASVLSADSIIRINNSLKDASTQARKNSTPGQDQAAEKKSPKARTRHRRQMSTSISQAAWTQKIYVLVTSGYLLQYAGDGPFDRLPEKILQLGKDSVAFASDLIPGKHWVLQISQSIDAGGMPTADSRSLMSRLTFRGTEYRRTATSFLLVLNSAKDMDSWIAVVRREIESLGGKKQLSETGRMKPDDKVLQLRAQPSRRRVSKRNPDQFSNPSSPVSPSSPSFSTSSWKVGNEAASQMRDPAGPTLHPPFSMSTPHQPVTSSMMFNNARQRENSRENTNRLSYMSSGQRTLVTSQDSSTTSSPTRESMTTFDGVSSKASNEDMRPRLSTHIFTERRRSMQTLQVQTSESLSKNHRHSTYGVPNRSPRSYMFPTPDSVKKSPSLTKRQPTEKLPPLPPIVTNIQSKTMLKGTRKSPPTPLNVSRPFSARNSPLSPKSAPPVFTPTTSSSRIPQQIKPCIINVPARSNPSTPVEVVHPERRSSLPVNNMEGTSSVRRNASMVALQDATSAMLEVPSRPPPLPPAALEVPLPLSPMYPHDVEIAINAAKLTASPVGTKPRRPASIETPNSGLPSPTISHLPLPKASKSPRSTKSGKSPRTLANKTYFPPFIKVAHNHSPARASENTQSLSPHNEISLANRRSMPMIMTGPPPLPPPECALPPLPPGNTSRSTVVSREPVQTQV